MDRGNLHEPGSKVAEAGPSAPWIAERHRDALRAVGPPNSCQVMAARRGRESIEHLPQRPRGSPASSRGVSRVPPPGSPRHSPSTTSRRRRDCQELCGRADRPPSGETSFTARFAGRCDWDSPASPGRLGPVWINVQRPAGLPIDARVLQGGGIDSSGAPGAVGDALTSTVGLRDLHKPSSSGADVDGAGR